MPECKGKAPGGGRHPWPKCKIQVCFHTCMPGRHLHKVGGGASTRFRGQQRPILGPHTSDQRDQGHRHETASRVVRVHDVEHRYNGILLSHKKE